MRENKKTKEEVDVSPVCLLSVQLCHLRETNSGPGFNQRSARRHKEGYAVQAVSNFFIQRRIRTGDHFIEGHCFLYGTKESQT